MAKRKFSNFTIKDALQLVGVPLVTPWTLDAPPRPPSPLLTETFNRLKSFDTQGSETGKILLINALLTEIVPNYPSLKIWTSAPLSTDTLTGFADYLVAPMYGYVTRPLLCVAEAKRDDFILGQAQCIAEMYACRWANEQQGLSLDVHGIVSNGQAWEFYKLTSESQILQSGLYTLLNLPLLLGVLDQVFADCARLLAQIDPQTNTNGTLNHHARN